MAGESRAHICPTWFEFSDEQGEAMGIVKLEQQTQCILCIIIGMKKNWRYSEILIIHVDETWSVTIITEKPEQWMKYSLKPELK